MATLLTTAVEHYRRQQILTVAGLSEVRSRRRRLSKAADALVAFQILAARDAANSVPLMLAEQGMPDRPEGAVSVVGLVGAASDGRPLESLLGQASTDAAFNLMVVTQLQDVARAAASLSVAVRPDVGGYVRMLNPPSCERCVVQAGKWFRWNEGFERHPKCDCRHVPASEATATDLTTNPDAYFASLSEGEQDRIFGKTGAQAIRDGADIGQVVNARRGMSVAQVGGRRTVVTTEGTTRFGRASRSRTGRRMPQRVMPETIYEVATDRADAIRLLQVNGFIL